MVSLKSILVLVSVFAINCLAKSRTRDRTDIVKPRYIDTAKTIPDGEYYIFAHHSGLVLQTDPCLSTGPSQPRIMQHQLNGNKNQKYRLKQTAEKVGYYYVESLETGQYWDIGGATFDDHESLTEFRFHGNYNQQFRFDPIGNNTNLYRIIARHSNKVMDVHYNSKDNNANVVQHNYNGGDNQKFRLVSAKVF